MNRLLRDLLRDRLFLTGVALLVLLSALLVAGGAAALGAVHVLRLAGRGGMPAPEELIF